MDKEQTEQAKSLLAEAGHIAPEEAPQAPQEQPQQQTAAQGPQGAPQQPELGGGVPALDVGAQPPVPPLEQQQVAIAAQRIQSEYQQIQAAMNSPEMQELLQYDPGSHSARLIVMRDRLAQLEQGARMVQAAVGDLHGRAAKAELKRLRATIPGWTNDITFDREKAELLDYARQQGYSDAELKNASAKDVRLIYKSWKGSGGRNKLTPNVANLRDRIQRPQELDRLIQRAESQERAARRGSSYSEKNAKMAAIGRVMKALNL